MTVTVYIVWVTLYIHVLLQRHMFQAMQDRFGAIDILCNNAGILDEKNWKKMIAVNMVNHALYGLLFRACGCLVFQVAMMESTHLAVEFMSHARGGRGGMVINVASIGGKLQLQYCSILYIIILL